MVNDVQVSDLIELFAENEEHRVQELRHFAEEVEPAELDDHQFIGSLGVIDGLALPVVTPEPCMDKALKD